VRNSNSLPEKLCPVAGVGAWIRQPIEFTKICGIGGIA
jgi:hypothetical protein